MKGINWNQFKPLRQLQLRFLALSDSNSGDSQNKSVTLFCATLIYSLLLLCMKIINIHCKIISCRQTFFAGKEFDSTKELIFQKLISIYISHVVCLSVCLYDRELLSHLWTDLHESGTKMSQILRGRLLWAFFFFFFPGPISTQVVSKCC